MEKQLQLTADEFISSTPQWSESVETLQAADGNFYIYPPDGPRDYRLDSPSEPIRRLLGALSGNESVQSLIDRYSDSEDTTKQLTELLGDLAGAKLLVDSRKQPGVLSDEQRVRFSRQLKYFAQEAEYGTDPATFQRKLSNSRIAILGVGGVGSWILAALAPMGIGHFRLVDGDVIELSNLNRQLLYGTADLGLSKVKAAGAWVNRLDSSVLVEPIDKILTSESDVKDIISDCDLVINAADTPMHMFGRWVDRTCRVAEVPYLAVSNLPPRIRIGPLFIPPSSPCLMCYEHGESERSTQFEELRDQRIKQGAASGFATSPTCALIGALVASEVEGLFTGLHAATSLDTAIVVNASTMAVTREKVRRRAECDCADT